MSRSLIPVVAGLFAWAVAMGADLPQVEVERMVVPGDAPSAIHLGEPVPLRVTVSLPAGYQAAPPQAVADQDELALRPGAVPQGSARPGGGMTQVFAFELIPLQLGEVTFSGFQVPWRQEGGEAGESVSGSLTLMVLATIEDPAEATAADIRGPAVLPVPSRLPWWGLGLLLLVLAAGLWLWWRRRRSFPAVAVVSREVDPFGGLEPAVWAVAALDTLERDDVLAHRGTVAFHVRLAEILRRYLGGRFHVPTLERTTHELLHDTVKHMGQLPGSRSRLRDLLTACDMVKFARLEPMPRASRELLGTTRLFVEETRPRSPVDAVAEGS